MLKRFVTKPSRHPFALWMVIAVAIFAACASGARSATPYPSAEAARFSIEVTGNGPDVILIPGLGCSREVWEATVGRLKTRYRLHVLNIAGFAGDAAGANAEGPVIDPSTEALNTYITEKGLKNVTIIGHSMGGLMGLRLASTHPQVVSRLVIVDALPFIGVLFAPNATADTIRPNAERMKDALIAAPAETFKAQQQAMMSRQTGGETYKARIIDWTVTSDRRVFAQAMYDDMVMDLRDDLGKVTAQTTLIFPWSPASGFSAEQTEAVYRQSYSGLKTMNFSRIDNSLHFIMYDQPEAFATALEAALQK